jgi:hypothetical protein
VSVTKVSELKRKAWDAYFVVGVVVRFGTKTTPWARIIRALNSEPQKLTATCDHCGCRRRRYRH